MSACHIGVTTVQKVGGGRSEGRSSKPEGLRAGGGVLGIGFWYILGLNLAVFCVIKSYLFCCSQPDLAYFSVLLLSKNKIVPSTALGHKTCPLSTGFLQVDFGALGSQRAACGGFSVSRGIVKCFTAVGHRPLAVVTTR